MKKLEIEHEWCAKQTAMRLFSYMDVWRRDRSHVESSSLVDICYHQRLGREYFPRPGPSLPEAAQHVEFEFRTRRQSTIRAVSWLPYTWIPSFINLHLTCCVVHHKKGASQKVMQFSCARLLSTMCKHRPKYKNVIGKGTALLPPAVSAVARPNR